MKKIVGLLGYPLAHSFSQRYFTEKFKNEGIGDFEYRKFELKDISDFESLLEKTPNLVGLNITIPYKEKILQYVDEASEIVSKIGAANTLLIQEDKSIKAYNTDVFGFAESIKPLLKTHHKKALILGTGGASKAINFALKKMNIETKFVSRKPKNSAHISYAELDVSIVSKYQIVVNTTPIGSFPETDLSPAFPYDFVTKNHIFYDLVYNPEETLFLKKAKQQGATIINGLKMLHLQAEKSWQIWIKKTN